MLFKYSQKTLTWLLSDNIHKLAHGGVGRILARTLLDYAGFDGSPCLLTIFPMMFAVHLYNDLDLSCILPRSIYTNAGNVLSIFNALLMWFCVVTKPTSLLS